MDRYIYCSGKLDVQWPALYILMNLLNLGPEAFTDPDHVAQVLAGQFKILVANQDKSDRGIELRQVANRLH